MNDFLWDRRRGGRAGASVRALGAPPGLFACRGTCRMALRLAVSGPAAAPLTGKLGGRPPRRSLAPGSTRRDPLAGTLRRRRDSPRPGESAPAGRCRVTAESDGARPPIMPRMRERIAPIPALLSTPSSPRAPSCPLFLVRTRNPDSFSQTTFQSTFVSARRRLSKEWFLQNGLQ